MQIRNMNEKDFVLRKISCVSRGSNPGRQDEAAIDLRSTGQSTAPQTPRVLINGEARISISELGQVIFVTAHSLCTEITRSLIPSRSFYKPSSVTLDLGPRTRDVTGISFMYKGHWGLRVKGHVEII